MEQLDMFYNTVPIEGAELKEAIKSSASQNKKILNIFQIERVAMPAHKVCQIYKKWYRQDILLTSCRRAITTLERLGYLVKTEYHVRGQYGINVNQWKIK